MKGNYNSIAPYYDRLSQIIFRHAIVNAQQYLADFISPNSAVLIVGGGTGWILEEIAKKHFEGVRITYVELSQKMTELSAKRNFGKNEVIFINESIQEVALDQEFDVAITPFLLDNFSTETTVGIFKKIDKHLVPGGLWLFADFQVNKNQRLWQKPLLKIMYLFFKLLCGIEANRLPDTNSLFDKYNYKKISFKTFFHDFICSAVYRKKDD